MPNKIRKFEDKVSQIGSDVFTVVALVYLTNKSNKKKLKQLGGKNRKIGDGGGKESEQDFASC